MSHQSRLYICFLNNSVNLLKMNNLMFGFVFVLVHLTVGQRAAPAADDGKPLLLLFDQTFMRYIIEFPAPSGCCDWPSCYDERTQLCLDTCLNTWSQCPRKLFLMTCYSEYMSPFGALPLQCFPDAAPHIDEAEEKGLTGAPKEV